MKLKKLVKALGVSALMLTLAGAFLGQKSTALAVNPYLPEWEHIPDGEPYVFEDPDNPGKERLYIYGSHDTSKTKYCGPDITVWSAPVEDLTDWRCDGVVFQYSAGGKQDTMYAPDVAMVTESDGSKTYYLYPNDQTSKRNTMVAKSKSPIGPFEPINLSSGEDPSSTGIMGFDPAVVVDDDGRVYGYWGFHTANMAELDPATMATAKEGTSIIKDAFEPYEDDDQIRFFEASSMRKIMGKYVFIYSRKTQSGEFGLGQSPATLAYLYSDTPLGPWTYGGTIVDARARNVDEEGKTFAAMAPTNTHGSLVEVNGQWYIFYHRSINNDGGYSRQGVAEPVDIQLTEDGKLEITEAEVTSEGLEINGLDPMKIYSAGISCYMTGGSYIKATWDPADIGGAVSNNVNGSVVGYKYLNFTDAVSKGIKNLMLTYTGTGTSGSITLRLDSPYASTGKDIGSISIDKTDSTVTPTTKLMSINPEDLGTGKHALYFIFQSEEETNICEFHSFSFTDKTEEELIPKPSESPSPTPAATVAPTATPDVTPAATATPAAATTTPAANSVSETAKSSLPAKAVIKTAKAKKRTAILTLKNTKNATGYEIQYSTSKKFKGAKKKSTKQLKVTLKKMKKKTYYIRVRAYCLTNGAKTYGSWSKVKKVKIK